MFLTNDQIAKLTGYQRPSYQIRWLRERGYPFDVAATGRPVVTREAVTTRACKTRQRGPNWSAV